MQRARVFRIPLEDGLGEGGDLGRSLVGPAVGHPVVPGAQVHGRLDVESLDVEIVREARRHLLHGRGVGLVPRGAVVLVARVTLRDRLDEGLLPGADLALQGDRFLRELQGLWLVLGGHERVDVRTQDQGLAPVRHRAIGVEACHLAEGAPRLRVIEAVGQVDRLVHEGLGLLRLRRDRKGVGAELEQARGELPGGRGLRGFLALRIVLVRRCVLALVGRGGRGREAEADEAGHGQDAGSGQTHGTPPKWMRESTLSRQGAAGVRRSTSAENPSRVRATISTCWAACAHCRCSRASRIAGSVFTP